MATRKGRIMRANEVRTGDTIMPPSSSEQRLVLQARTERDTTTLHYTAGTAHMPATTPVRVHRNSRTESNDIPQLVFKTGA